MLITRDGREITQEALTKAVGEGRAVIFFRHGTWKTEESVAIYTTKEKADEMAEIATRGKLQTMSGEVWARKPTLHEALKACSLC